MLAALASSATFASVLISGAVVAPTAAHAASGGRVVNAWLPYWDITSAMQSTTANADLVKEASPFWFQISDQNTVSLKSGATSAQLQSIVATLHAKGVQIIPTITDALPAANSAAIMADPGARAAMVNTLASLIGVYNVDGLDLDFETIAFASNATLAPQIRTGYVSLLRDLAARLHASGKILTVAVLAKTQEGTSVASQAYNYSAIGAVVDRVRIMTYDQHTANTAYPGGPVSSVQWVDSVLQYATSVIPASKIEMGVPLYGYDYTNAGHAVAVSFTQANNLMIQNHAQRQWSAADGSPYFTYTATDGSQHTVWYDDAESVAARLPLIAKYNLAGLTFWSLGDEDPGIWGELRTLTYGPNPFGSYDALSAAPGGAQLSGWAIDANTTDPVRIDIYSNNRGITSLTANSNRADIASRYFVYGAAHGFSGTIPLPAGANNVCAFAINVGVGGNTLLGCKTVNVLSGSPFGAYDAASRGGPGVASISGWALDPDVVASPRVDVYVDGHGATSVYATDTRTDVAALYPVYGSAHGFHARLTVGGGTHQICAFAINVGPGGNTLLGCRTVTLPTGSPTGVIDSATASPGAVHISGWTIDPDVADGTRVDVYVDGHGVSTQATNDRPDIAAAFPGYGPAHGFNLSLNVSSGKHSVCAFAINIGPGANTLLGCRTVTTPSGSPYGSIDSATGGVGQVEVKGWAIDPDTTSPVRVDMYVDGKGAASASANGDRPDIAAAFAGYGAAHGFDTTITGLAPGQHKVCLYAINVGVGAPATLLGCPAFTSQ